MHIFPLLFSVHVILLVFQIHQNYSGNRPQNHPFVSLKSREKMLFVGYLILRFVRASSIRAAGSVDGTGLFSQSRRSQASTVAVVWCNKCNNRHSYALEYRGHNGSSCWRSWSIPSWWLYLRSLWEEYPLTSQWREYHNYSAEHMT